MNSRLQALHNQIDRINRLRRKRIDHRSFAHGKEELHRYFKATANHKKLPHKLEHRESHKDPNYSKLSIEEWENKYL